MGLALSNAHKAVQQAIADIPKELAEDVRLLELERLDRMLAGMWPKAIAGDPKAVAAAVKIMDRRAKYLGIDAPVRTELTGKDGGPIETKSGYDDLLTKLARIASDAAKVAEPADSAETGPTDGTPVVPRRRNGRFNGMGDFFFLRNGTACRRSPAVSTGVLRYVRLFAGPS